MTGDDRGARLEGEADGEVRVGGGRAGARSEKAAGEFGQHPALEGREKRGGRARPHPGEEVARDFEGAGAHPMDEEGKAEAEERGEPGVFAEVGEGGEQDGHHQAAAPAAPKTIEEQDEEQEGRDHHARTAMREDERGMDAVEVGEGEGDGAAAVHRPGECQAAGEIRHGLGRGAEQGEVFGEVGHPFGREEEQEPARAACEGGEERACEGGQAAARHAPDPQVGEQEGEAEEQAAREVERVPGNEAAQARNLCREEQHEVVVAEADVWVEGEMGRDVAARHERDGGQVLVVFEEGQAAANGGEDVNEEGERGNLSPRGGQEGAADLVPRKRAGEEQAEGEGEERAQPEGRRRGQDAPQQVGKPGLRHRAERQPRPEDEAPRGAERGLNEEHPARRPGEEPEEEGEFGGHGASIHW